MSESEYQQRLEQIRETYLKTLHKPEKVRQLDEFCSLMDKHELPPAARLFIFDQGVQSLKNLSAKHHQLVASMEEAVNLGFSIKCMKDFVRQCVVESEYDYPTVDELPGTYPSAQMSSGSKSAPRTSQTLPATLEQQQPQPQPNRVSQDQGYYSKEQGQQQQQQQQPAVKSRSFSVQLNKPADQQPQPQSKSQSHSPSKSPSKGKSFMSLFLFPENARKSKRDQRGHGSSNT